MTTQEKPQNLMRKNLGGKGRYGSWPHKSQFVWNDEKIQIFSLLLAGMTKRDMKALGHHHEKIRRVERQLRNGNYPPGVKEEGIVVWIETSLDNNVSQSARSG